MPVIARDAVASDHLVYAWPFPIGPEEHEVSCADDELVVMCPAWMVGDRLGPGRHRWRTPDPSRPVSAYFVLTAPVEVSFDMITAFMMPSNGQHVRLRATGSLQVRCLDPALLVAQFVGLPFDHVNDGVLRSVSRSLERMLARLLTRRVVMAGTPQAVTDPQMLQNIVEELIAYNPTAGAVFGVELVRFGHLTIMADDGQRPWQHMTASNGQSAPPMSRPDIPLLETVRAPMPPRTEQATVRHAAVVPPPELVPPSQPQQPPQRNTPSTPPPIPQAAKRPQSWPQSEVSGEIGGNRNNSSATSSASTGGAVSGEIGGNRNNSSSSSATSSASSGGAVSGEIGGKKEKTTAPGHTPAAAPTVQSSAVPPPPGAPASGSNAAQPPIPAPPGLNPNRPMNSPVPAGRRAGSVEVPQSTDEITQPGIDIIRTPLPGSLQNPMPGQASASSSSSSHAQGTPPPPEAPSESRGAIMGIGMAPIGASSSSTSNTTSGEITKKIAPGGRVLVPGPNGLMQSATVRQLLQGYYELEVGGSGETIWVPINGVVPEN